MAIGFDQSGVLFDSTLYTFDGLASSVGVPSGLAGRVKPSELAGATGPSQLAGRTKPTGLAGQD